MTPYRLNWRLIITGNRSVPNQNCALIRIVIWHQMLIYSPKTWLIIFLNLICQLTPMLHILFDCNITNWHFFIPKWTQNLVPIEKLKYTLFYAQFNFKYTGNFRGSQISIFHLIEFQPSEIANFHKNQSLETLNRYIFWNWSFLITKVTVFRERHHSN